MTTTKKRFLKVRIGRHTRLVEEIRPGAGWRVTLDGQVWGRLKDETLTKELVLFTAKDIVCEMRMNNHYCELEAITTGEDR